MEDSFEDFDDWRTFLDLSENELDQTLEFKTEIFFKKVETFRDDSDVKTSENGKFFVIKLSE
jgi:hypothetical protein